VKVVMGKHAGGSSGRYAGTISQRLKDLQDALLYAGYCMNVL